MNGTTTYQNVIFGCWTLVAALTGSYNAEAVAEFEEFQGKPTNQATKRDCGSAGVLRGKVLLAHVFVRDPNSGWPKEKRREVRRRLRQATDFIELEAARYEAPLVFKQTSVDTRFERSIPLEMAADPACSQRVIRSVADTSPNQWVERLRREHRADHVLVVLHVNQAARSHNLTYSRGIDAEYRAECAICFFCYEDDRPTAAASYVHEILHGFGAGELYFPFDKTEDRRRLGGRWFPNDVMQRVDYDLGELEIGVYTAFRIGWLDALPDKYLVFEDPN